LTFKIPDAYDILAYYKITEGNMATFGEIKSLQSDKNSISIVDSIPSTGTDSQGRTWNVVFVKTPKRASLLSSAIKWTGATQANLNLQLKIVSLAAQYINAKREEGGKVALAGLDNLKEGIGGFRRVLVFLCLPGLYKSAHESVSQWRADKNCLPGLSNATFFSMVASVSDFVSAGTGALKVALPWVKGNVVKGNVIYRALGPIGKIASPLEDLASACEHKIKYQFLNKMIRENSGLKTSEFQNQLKEDKIACLLKLVAKTMAVFEVSLVLMGIAVGAPVALVSTHLAISLTSAVVGMSGKIWSASLGRGALDFYVPCQETA
jgi:hypothetical protein